jgi:hypothetical protein
MCVPQKHAQGSRRAAEAVLAASRWRRSRWNGRRSCRTRRSERNWTGASASASGSVLPVAGSARFRRRVRVQSNRPRASRLRARGAGAEQEQRAGNGTRRDGPAGGYAGVPAMFLQHTCVSRGGSAREQEDLEVRGGIDIANQSSPISFSHKSTTSSSSYSSSIAQARPQHLEKAPGLSYRAFSIPVCRNIVAVAKPTAVATGHREDYSSGHPPPTTNPLASFFVTHGTSPPSSSSHRRSCSPREFTFHPFSSTTKATPRFALIH